MTKKGQNFRSVPFLSYLTLSCFAGTMRYGLRFLHFRGAPCFAGAMRCNLHFSRFRGASSCFAGAMRYGLRPSLMSAFVKRSEFHASMNSECLTHCCATSFIEKLILPILSLPRHTTVTLSPRVSTSSTRLILSFAILEM